MLHPKRLTLLIAAMIAAIIPIGIATRVEADSSVPPAITLNAPQVPQSGNFLVNSTSDSSAASGVMTLRKAILLANGGTDAGSGLGRALTPGEQAQISGCTIDGSGYIIGGCGAGVLDFITFDVSLSSSPTITLSSNLHITDTQPVIINGGTVNPVLNAGGVIYNSALIVFSNANSISHMTIRNSGSTGIEIIGDNNSLSYITVVGSGSSGILISGNGNTVNQSLVGISSITATTCGTTGNYDGIDIANGANNQVKNSYMSCNSNYGVFAAGNNTVGPSNVIGTDSSGTVNLGNPTGVNLSGGSQATVVTNTILFSGYGIYMANTALANIGGNTIRRNSTGIWIAGTSQNNKIGGPSSGSSLTGNVISANVNDGVAIYDSAQNNLLAGNKIGTTANGLNADGNGYSGVYIRGAPNNYIGDPAAAMNIISGNLTGVYIQDGAANNQVANNYIGSFSFGVLIPNETGIALKGALTTTVSSNVVQNNLSCGICIQYDNSFHLPTYGNQVLSNTIRFNKQDGILLDAGGTANGVTNNIINGNSIHDNAGDGIHESGSAVNNVWTQISTYNNGGLGISKSVSTPAHPTIQSVTHNATQWTISGTATPSSGAHPVSVEVYLAAADPTGFGEGKTFLGIASVNGTGNWSLNTPNANAGCYATFETYTNSTVTGSATSSDFSANVCGIKYLYLPLIVR